MEYQHLSNLPVLSLGMSIGDLCMDIELKDTIQVFQQLILNSSDLLKHSRILAKVTQIICLKLFGQNEKKLPCMDVYKYQHRTMVSIKFRSNPTFFGL